MLNYPWSAISALIYIYALVLIYALSHSHPKLRCLYSGKACMITIAAAAFLAAVYGFTGFHRNLFYYAVMLAMLSSMGLALTDDLCHIRKRKPAMTLAHLSVFVVMAVGIFGSGDKRAAYLEAHLNTPVSEAVDKEGKIVQLPFLLTLKSFTIDQYPPKLMLSGDENSESLEVEKEGASATLDKWNIVVLKAYDMALPSAEGFCEFNHTGAEPALYVHAENSTSGQSTEGWISCGSFLFNPVSLALPDGRELYMPRPMPKKYESKILAVDATGREYEFEIAVNHPAHIGKWRIYQADYDATRERWSTLSVFQCVYDPWYPIIQIGLWLILASALLMFITAGTGTKREKK